MNTIELTGLKGDNPMAFLAALGVTNALSSQGVLLEWKNSAVPLAVLHTSQSETSLVDLLMKDLDQVATWQSLERKNFKMSSEDLQVFLQGGAHDEQALLACLLSDITVDGSGNPKPSDLYFCAGQQSFMGIAKSLAESVTKEELHEALFGPWTYRSLKRGTFMWDTRDDRNYALMATNPVTTDKVTMPGCDWLAFRGLGLLPSFGTDERIFTPGTSGGWKRGAWAWLLWQGAVRAGSIRTLMQQLPRSRKVDFGSWKAPRGVFRVYQSLIQRSDQGGYGTILPPQQVWSEE